MRKRHWKRGERSGFTFTEVLVAVTLLVIGFMGIYASMHSSALVRETAHETNVAMFKLQTAQEYVFVVPFDEITATFPEGTPVDIVSMTESIDKNDFRLRDEQITVSYDDPNADPLRFTVTIDWVSRTGTPRCENISCARAR